MALAVSVGHADVVERRGAEPALEGRITTIDAAGVTVRSDLGAVHLVPWDRVRRVVHEGLDPSLLVRLETHRGTGESETREGVCRFLESRGFETRTGGRDLVTAWRTAS